MPIINIGNGMFLNTDTGQMSSNLYGSTPSSAGALTTSISAPVAQSAPAVTPTPVTAPTSGALTQAISTPIGTGGLPATVAQVAPPPPAAVIPDWFKNTPEYASLTTGGTPDTVNYNGDTIAGTPGTPPTAAQVADAYKNYSTANAGAYNMYADPNYVAANTYLGVQGEDPTYSGAASVTPTYSMLPDSLKNMPGSTNGNMWGLSFDPATNTFMQKMPGNAGTGTAGIDAYQQYDARGNAIGNPVVHDNSGSGWVDFRNWAEQTVPMIASLAIPGIAPIVQGINAGYQASQGNYLGALASGAGALGAINIPATDAAGVSGMDLAGNAATGGNSLNAAAGALDNGAGALSAASGITLKNVADAAKIAQSVKNGDYANALIGGVNMSGQLPATIDGVSTSDMTKLANAALAISSGNPASIVNSMINSGKTWDAANNVWNDATAPAPAVGSLQDQLVEGPVNDPNAYALPADGTIPAPTNSAEEQAANAAADALLNGGALTQAISNPTDQRLGNGTQTTPGALADVINTPAEPNAIPLDKVTTTGTQYPPADQAVQDALNQYSTATPNAIPLDNVTVTGTQYLPADQAVQDALNPYSPAAPNAVPLDKVTVTGTQPPADSTLYGQVPAEQGLPPVETPPTVVPAAPTVPTVPTIPTLPKKSVVVVPKTVAPLPQQNANHLPGVDMSFLTHGAIIDEQNLLPMAQKLVEQSGWSMSLPQAMQMVKQNQPKGTA